MQIDKESGKLLNVEFIASPNYDERPDPDDISLIVVHNISLPPGEFGGPWISDLFTNNLDPQYHPFFQEIHQMTVSSHFLIRRDGHIIQYVPLHKRAWHAGKSNYRGRERCNDFSIGIELEGSDDTPFEDQQYQQLSRLIQALCDTYSALNDETLTGHSDIAPGRKTDPGPHFDWARLRKLLKSE